MKRTKGRRVLLTVIFCTLFWGIWLWSGFRLSKSLAAESSAPVNVEADARGLSQDLWLAQKGLAFGEVPKEALGAGRVCRETDREVRYFSTVEEYLGTPAPLSFSGSTVDVVKGNSLRYESWETSIYTVYDEAGNAYMGYCAEPEQASPSGTFTVTEIEDDLLKSALLVLCGGPYDRTGNGTYFGTRDYNLRYGYSHAIIGYLYSGSMKGLSEEHKYIFEAMYWTFFHADNPGVPELYDPQLVEWRKEWRLFVAENDKQDIVWIEPRTEEPTRCRFIKVDEKGEPMAGCGFELRDLQGGLVAAWETDASGVFVLDGGLKAGEEYTLIEVSWPLGYEPETVSRTFRAAAGPEWQEVRSVNRRIPATVTVKKTGPNGTAQEGVVFRLFQTGFVAGAETFAYGGKTYYRSDVGTTDATGEVRFGGLDGTGSQSYLLREESAAGASLLTAPILLGTLPLAGDAASSGDGARTTYKDGKYYFYDVICRVQNGARFVLPLTGAKADPWSAIFVGVLGASVGLLLMWPGTSMEKRRRI